MATVITESKTISQELKLHREQVNNFPTFVEHKLKIHLANKVPFFRRVKFASPTMNEANSLLSQRSWKW